MRRYAPSSFESLATLGRLRMTAALLLARGAIGEARIAEPGADGQHAPALDVLHEWHLAQALHHRVIMHQHGGVIAADGRDGLAQGARQVETAARPVAGQ